MAENPADYPFRVNKVTISGDCFSGAEIWSTGFYMGKPTADADNPVPGVAAIVAGYWQAFFTASTSSVSNAYRTTEVKVSQLETDGDTDLNMIDYHTYGTAIVGANAGIAMPPQVTLAATLTSARTRGLASKGRMYLPGVNFSLPSTSPKITATQAGQIATNLKTMFDGLRADVALGDDPMLASKGHKVTPSIPNDPIFYVGGIIEPITGLQVGDVYDTQRRRRNDLAEVYQTRVLV